MLFRALTISTRRNYVLLRHHQHHHQQQQQHQYSVSLRCSSFLLPSSCTSCEQSKQSHLLAIAPARPTSSNRFQTYQRFSSSSLLSSSLLVSRNCAQQQKEWRIVIRRFLSSSTLDSTTGGYDLIRILYASQTGTAQLFAMQLLEAIEEEISNNNNINKVQATVSALSDIDPADVLLNNDNETSQKSILNCFIVSTAGVGEPPDNGRVFYEKLQGMTNENTTSSKNTASTTNIVFALGNSKAHPNNFCAFGKNIAQQLQDRMTTANGGIVVNGSTNSSMPYLTLGDDGSDECLEDKFDAWQNDLIQSIQALMMSSDDTAAVVKSEKESKEEEKATACQHEPPGAEKQTTTTVLCSGKHPKLVLSEPPEEIAASLRFHEDLLDTMPSFYKEGTARIPVVSNRNINPSNHSVSSLRELVLDLNNSGDPKSCTHYEAGDHLIVYPSNSDVIVDAYLSVIEPPCNPDAIITLPPDDKQRSMYPHPIGISVRDTFLYCVDLGAPPSPAFSRFLTGKTREQMDYTKDIANTRRTVLDLLLNVVGKRKIAIEDMLYNLPPLKPRYYSIASSARVHPNQVYLTYRPVKYMTQQGFLREGLSTSYMSSISATEDIVCAIRSNPTFRLPKQPRKSTDTAPPILLVAGGCGIAPIRAFLEELIYNSKLPDNNEDKKKYGPVHLFLGFRNPTDEAYQDLVEEACQLGIIATKYVTYNTGSPPGQRNCLVSDAVLEKSQLIYHLIHTEKAVMYLCGGARTFGAAIENAVQHMLQTEGGYTPDKSAEFLRSMIAEGRLHEDLSD